MTKKLSEIQILFRLDLGVVSISGVGYSDIHLIHTFFRPKEWCKHNFFLHFFQAKRVNGFVEKKLLLLSTVQCPLKLFVKVNSVSLQATFLCPDFKWIYRQRPKSEHVGILEAWHLSHFHLVFSKLNVRKLNIFVRTFAFQTQIAGKS